MRVRVAAVAAVFVAVVVAAGGPAAAAGPLRDGPLRAVSLPDTGRDGHWWFTTWQISRVWAAGARGQGVTVAVIDTGVQATRAELQGVVLPGTDWRGGDGRTDQSQRVSGNTDGHGTHMASLIAAQGGPSGLVGVAPDAKILPIVLPTGVEDDGKAIRWAVDHGAKVINMSFAASGPCQEPVQAAVRYAIERGAVVVAGSGNDGAFDDEGFVYPANCSGAVAVTAFDYRLNGYTMNNKGPYVGVAAPGVDMPKVNLKGQRTLGTGTSSATALTSGAIALVWSKYPQLTNRQVVARLLATTKDLGAPGKDDEFGYGGVRPYQAITTEVAADAPNPIFDRLPAATPTPSTAPAAPDRDRPGTKTPSSGTSLNPFTLLVVLAVGGVVLVVVLAGVAIFLTGRSSRRRRQGPVTGYPSAGSGPAPPPGPMPGPMSGPGNQGPWPPGRSG